MIGSGKVPDDQLKELRLNFGRYRGTALGDVDQSYLEWMAGLKLSAATPPIKGGLNWTNLANQELERRQKAPFKAEQPFYTGSDPPWVVREEVSQRDEAVTASETTISLETLRNNTSTQIKGMAEEEVLPHLEVLIHLDSLNSASLLLIREFILRSDKSEGLVEWLTQVAREAIKHGKGSIAGSGRWSLTYMNLSFVFERQSSWAILQRITEAE